MVIVLAMALTACEDQPAGEQARLIVREELSGPLYAEGSVAFLQLSGTGADEPVFHGGVTGGAQAPGDDPLVDRRLPAGSYRLVSYQRLCQGNCQRLDPPTDRCETTLSLQGGQTVTTTVLVRRFTGCTIKTHSAKPSTTN